MDTNVNGVPSSTPERGTSGPGAPEPGPEEPGTAETSAAEYLRDRLGLTDTKVACGSEACGACTVLVDGSPTASCLLPAAHLAGRSVTTVEGLGGDHPVQRAFAAHDALQCGYCTPGFIVSASVFVDSWRAEHGDLTPDRDTIADALAGHLCRCGAYEGVFAAVAAACSGRFDTDPVQAPPRSDAPDKITGRARFSGDHAPPGTWTGVIVRSTEPHARVLKVEPAPGPDGVRAPIVDLLGEERVVRYVGQPIAAVAAPTGPKHDVWPMRCAWTWSHCPR